MSNGGGILNRLRRAIRWIFKPGDSLGHQAVNAGFWAAALRLSTRALRIVRTIVLARLLVPDDFGLFGMAALAMMTIMAFSRTGVNQALVQREGDIEGHLNTAFAINVVRGLFLGAVLFFGAPLISGFFDTPEIVPLVRAVALAPIFQGFINVGVIFFDKDLQFRQRFMYRSLPRIVELVGSVILALILQSVWALVLGLVLAHLSSLIASYVSHPYRPRLRFSRDRAKELVNYGKWISVSSIVIFLMLNLDDIVVGRLLTPEDLGLYQMAFTLSTIVNYEVAQVVGQVTFPAFSKLQSEPKVLKRAYLETVQFVAFASLPLAAGLWFLGPNAIEVLLGPEWLGLLPAFGPLLLWGVTRAISGTANPMFDAMGKPQINSALFGGAAAALAIVIVPFTRTWGIAGAAWATVAAAAVYVFQFWLAARHLEIRRSVMARTVWIPGLITLVMWLTLEAIDPLFSDLNPRWQLLWAPILGLIVFAAGTWVARRLLDYKPLDVFTKLNRR